MSSISQGLTLNYWIYESRLDITEKAFHLQNDLQKTLRKLVVLLGPNGMSGDESDPEHDPDLSRDKVPTRLILPWLNPEITHVFARLDGKKPRGHLIAPRGNRSFTRNEDRKTAPSDLCHPVRKLPINWYHPV